MTFPWVKIEAPGSSAAEAVDHGGVTFGLAGALEARRRIGGGGYFSVVQNCCGPPSHPPRGTC